MNALQTTASAQEPRNYTPVVVSRADAISILDSGDPIAMMGLPDAWFESGAGRHRVCVNPITAGLRAIAAGHDLHGLRDASREMGKRISSEFLGELEGIDDDDIEIVEFARIDVSQDVSAKRLQALQDAAARMGESLPRVLAAILGRTLH